MTVFDAAEAADQPHNTMLIMELLKHDHAPTADRSLSNEKHVQVQRQPRRIMSLPFFMVLLTNGFHNAAYSLLSAFLPTQAMAQGVSELQVSIIFVTYSVAALVGCALVSRWCATWGVRRLMVTGLVVMSAAIGCMACLQTVNGTTFFLVAITLRLVQGLGGAFVETAAVGATLNMFAAGDGLGTGLAKLEMSGSYGFLLGPVIGGWAFELGGFVCPFVIAAGSLLLMAAVSASILESKPVEADSEAPVPWASFAAPSFLWFILLIVLNYSASVFLDPTLGPYLATTFGLTAGNIGTVFSVACIVYTIAAPLSAWLANKLGNTILVLVGHILMAVGFCMIGCFMHWIPQYLAVCLTGVVLMNIGLGLSLVPIMESFVRHATARGLSEPVVSALLPSAYSASEIIGPMLGSSLTDAYSFEFACAVFAALLLTGCGVHLGLTRTTTTSQRPEKLEYIYV